MKFSTDGAILCNKKNGVQGTMKLIDVDLHGKALPTYASNLPEYFNTEICLYYYIGKLSRKSLDAPKELISSKLIVFSK